MIIHLQMGAKENIPYLHNAFGIMDDHLLTPLNFSYANFLFKKLILCKSKVALPMNNF